MVQNQGPGYFRYIRLSRNLTVFVINIVLKFIAFINIAANKKRGFVVNNSRESLQLYEKKKSVINKSVNNQCYIYYAHSCDNFYLTDLFIGQTRYQK